MNKNIRNIVIAFLILVVLSFLIVYFVAKNSSTNNSNSSSNSSNSLVTSTSISSSTDLTSGYKQASWGNNVTINYSSGFIEYKSNGLPNHDRQKMYALPNNNGMGIPTASTAYAGADPSKEQNYNFKITTNPKKAEKTTNTNLGTIGVMISGAALFNPYEGDGKTIATASNFTVKDSEGNDVAFLDSCSGHPNPSGSYHYHALPKCITSKIDKADGPSHILGIAFDGFPIYGDKDIDGKQILANQLDACNGITSKTPEFPEGVYHYVLLETTEANSSIRCFSGTVDSSLTSMNMGGGMGNGMPPQR